MITPAGPRATGWLVAPDDPADLADTIVTAVQDTRQRQRRSANGPAHVQTTYSWTRTADQYLAIYDSARSGRRNAMS
jgi:D-inositol-3-phosphate glycosyltransferase